MWIQCLERKNNERIGRLRSKLKDNFKVMLEKLGSSKSPSTMTKPRYEVNDLRMTPPSGSENRQFIDTRASEYQNIDKHPEEGYYRCELSADVDSTHICVAAFYHVLVLKGVMTSGVCLLTL